MPKMSTEEHNIIFVFDAKAAGSKSQNPAEVSSQIMHSAFKSFRQRKLNPKWLEANKILANEELGVEPLFVIDTFSGPIFEHLEKMGARIISPYVVKYCDSDLAQFETIPKRSYPLFSQCMRGLTVTCTNLPTDTKKAIESKVIQMCGTYDTSLNGTTKYLISNSVLTKKYQAAVLLKIPVMRVEWIEECWEKYQYKLERADSPEIISKYLLPIFYGLTVTVSQLDQDERDEVQDLITKHGGTYSGALRVDVPNSVLLLREKSGEKYHFAKKKNTPRMRLEWLKDSIKARYALFEHNYSIDIDEDHNDEAPMIKKIHLIQSNNKISSTSEDKSPTNHYHDSSTSKLFADNNDLIVSKDLADKLDELASNVSDAILDNCVLLPLGFDRQTLSSIKNAARQCGAFCMSEVKPMVTHVIIGPEFNNAEFIKQIEEHKIDKIVTIDWFIASLKSFDCHSHIPYKYNPSQPISNGTDSSNGSKNKFSNLDILTTEASEICKRINITGAVSVEPKPVQLSQNYKSLAGDSDDDDENPIKWSPKVKIPLLNLKADDDNSGRFSNNLGPERVAKQILRDNSPESDRNSKKQNNANANDSTKDSNNDDIEMSNDTDYTTNNNQQATLSLNFKKPTCDTHSSNVTPMINSSSHGSMESPFLSNHVFMFSGFDNEQKERMIRLVKERFSVRVKEDNLVSDETTHLILNEPFATEKTISAIAAGMWIMKPEFIYNSLAAGQLLSEADYQWGNNYHNFSNSTIRQRLMISGIAWRHHIAEVGAKAFQDWPILILNHTKSITSSINILLAGKAKVYYLDDFVDKNEELKALFPQIKYALVDVRFEQKPPFTKQFYLNVVGWLASKRKLIRQEFVSRYIIDGQPDASAVEKCLVSANDIQAVVASVY